MATDNLDSGFDSIDKGSIDNTGIGYMPEIGTVPGDNVGPSSGLGLDTCVYDNDSDQAYVSLDERLLSLQPESLPDQLLSMVIQNTSDDFQDESNRSAGGSGDSIATTPEQSLSTTSSTSTTLQSNEDNTAAQRHPPSSDTEKDSSPLESALELGRKVLEGTDAIAPITDTHAAGDVPITDTHAAGDVPITDTHAAGDVPITDTHAAGDVPITDTHAAGDVPITDTHEASNASGNGAHDMNQDALPSATLSNVTAQNVRSYREIVIRGPVDEKHTEVISERVLIEPSSPK